MIESGLIFLKQLFILGFINNLYLFKSNKLLRKRGFNNSNINFIKKLNLKNKINVNLKNDNLFKIRVK